jgi:hypothetical protein
MNTLPMETLTMQTQWRDLCARIAPRRPPAPRATLFADPDVGPQPAPAAKRPRCNGLGPIAFMFLDIGWMLIIFLAAHLLINAGMLRAATVVSLCGVFSGAILWIVYCYRRHYHV